jgi:dihydropyrimidinase
VISSATHHMRVDYSAYEGRKVRGVSEIVLSRGNVVVEDGAFKGKAGEGRFLKRSAFA